MIQPQTPSPWQCSRLRRDERGVTVVEFALLAPVLLVTLLGMFDMGYTMYAQTLLQGEAKLQNEAKGRPWFSSFNTQLSGGRPRNLTVCPRASVLVSTRVKSPIAETDICRSETNSAQYQSRD